MGWWQSGAAAKSALQRLGVRLLVAACIAGWGGCGLFFLAPVDRVSLLIPKTGRLEEGSVVESDGSIAYETWGLRVVVRYMSDADLNQLFPRESSLEEYSINPYTFGNYVDPSVGYVQNRFTVFGVSVYNEGLAKVKLDPLRALLTTDRRGEVLQAYGIQAGSAPRNFESYYRSRRGPSGNDYYRFNMRMGIVRSNNYGVDEMIFRGESYEGLIVFDPLDDRVSAVSLLLREVGVEFSAYDVPLETIDLRFDFRREIQLREVAELSPWVEDTATAVRLSAPSQVRGNITGDASRESAAVDGMIDRHMPGINECFEAEFMAGRAAEGQLEVRFAIDPQGQVRHLEVVRSTVVSPAVGVCVAREMRNWQFGPSRIPVQLIEIERGDSPDAYLVWVDSFFEFIDVRGM